MYKVDVGGKAEITGNAFGRISKGHLWIFKNEIKAVTEDLRDGDLVDVTFKGRFVARGYYNSNSQISIRILTFKPEPIDVSFFKRRLREALELRKISGLLDPDSPHESFRLIYSEGDRLPGVIIDKYATDKGTLLVMAVLTLGMETLKGLLIRALEEILKPVAIVEKSDTALRNLEGLPPFRGVVHGELPKGELIIEQDGVRFLVDPLGGQKTGFYFDQRFNRLALAKNSRGKTFLDVFSYTGGFGLYALKHGALKVEFIEESDRAVEILRYNLELNGVKDRAFIHQGNAFQIIRELRREGRTYDVVNLDPPAFAKTRGGLEGAYRGYKDINIQGMRVLNDGGVLATSSCSQKMKEEWLEEIILEAASDNKRDLQLIYRGSQGPDHPVLLAMPETRYLKFFMFRVFKRT